MLEEEQQPMDNRPLFLVAGILACLRGVQHPLLNYYHKLSREHKAAIDEWKKHTPVNGKEIATYAGHTDSEVRAILEEVGTAQKKWAALPFSERSRNFHAIAAQLRKEAPELAKTMALEMGKPVTQGLAEIEKCAVNCDFAVVNDLVWQA